MDAMDVTKIVVKGAISNVPIVGGVIAEIIGYLDQRHIEKRLNALENEVQRMGYALDDFIKRLYALENDEHQYYAVRGNIKYLCLSALPETTDAFNKALIEEIMSDTPTMAEYACEIIKQLNADDINLLVAIKQFQEKKKEGEDAARS